MPQRPLIRLVVDTRNWAFDNIADHIIHHLSEKFRFDRIYAADFEGRYGQLIGEALVKGSPSCVHFFWRELWSQWVRDPNRISAIEVTAGASMEEVLRSVSVTSSVYDHLFSKPEEVAARRSAFSLLDGLSVSSQRLQRLYAEYLPSLKTTVLSDGIDPALFAEQTPKLRDETFVVGWVGNSEWGSGLADDPKGVKSILRPALELLRRSGYSVQEDFADRNLRQRPRAEMPHYYRNIDVLVCSSSIEGTPNPVLEAMACGIPVVSTDVGVVGEVFGPLARNVALVERDPAAVAAALGRIADDPALGAALRSENLERIGAWTWASRMSDWETFFDEALNGKPARIGPQWGLLQSMRERQRVEQHRKESVERWRQERARLMQQRSNLEGELAEKVAFADEASRELREVVGERVSMERRMREREEMARSRQERRVKDLQDRLRRNRARIRSLEAQLGFPSSTSK